jgi:hypothetical protein
MKAKIAGILIFLLIVAGAIVYQFMGRAPKSVTLKGYVGGEKINLLRNEKIKKILAREYGIIIDYTKAGSIEMVKEIPKEDTDFLWPSSQVALELFKKSQSSRLVKSEIIFNSPIVIYTWDIIGDRLRNNGMVQEKDGTLFIRDFQKLIDMVVSGKKWSEIGIGQLYGKMSIISTDPSKSNSGNMFSGLLATIVNGDVVETSHLPTILPVVRDYYKRLGYMEHSSSDLFEQYLRTGVGAKPMIAGYESQLIEFSLQHPDLWPKVKDKMRILYPVPTVWSSHPVIILNPRAKGLIQALQDEDIQRIAWEEHGFRTGMMGVQNDPKVLKVVGIPATIQQVVPMPSPEVMDAIIQAVR